MSAYIHVGFIKKILMSLKISFLSVQYFMRYYNILFLITNFWHSNRPNYLMLAFHEAGQRGTFYPELLEMNCQIVFPYFPVGINNSNFSLQSISFLYVEKWIRNAVHVQLKIKVVMYTSTVSYLIFFPWHKKDGYYTKIFLNYQELLVRHAGRVVEFAWILSNVRRFILMVVCQDAWGASRSVAWSKSDCPLCL